MKINTDYYREERTYKMNFGLNFEPSVKAGGTLAFGSNDQTDYTKVAQAPAIDFSQNSGVDPLKGRTDISAFFGAQS